jgi:catechol 2,3-dioxygenase-like lactoylglutathione lyase family enzyme
MNNPVLGNGGVHHVCIKTRDWDRTMAFYQKVLGCTEKLAWRAAPQRAAMLDTGGGNYIEVFEDLGYTPQPDGAILHVALRTSRLDAVAVRVREFGATITVEPKDVTIASTNGAGPVPIRIFFCEGPSGEVLEFFQNALT